MTDSIRVTGKLHDQAMLGYTPGDKPQAVLSFELHPTKGLPYRVRQTLGADPIVHMSAAAKARALTRGTEVTVYGSGCRLQSDHGIAALLILDVTDIHPHAIPSAASQAEAAPSKEL